MSRGVSIFRFTTVACVVLAANAGFLGVLFLNPGLKDLVPYLILVFAGMAIVGIVAFIVSEIPENGSRLANAGLVGLICLQVVLTAGAFYWLWKATHSPLEITNARMELSDDSPVGTVVGRVSVNAYTRSPRRFLFHRRSSDGSRNFHFNETTGEITLVSTDMLNARKWDAFYFEVEVSDDWGALGKGRLVIEITDENQPPELSNQVMEFNSYARQSHTIGYVRADDPDNDRLTYRVVEGNEAGLFVLDDDRLRTTDEYKPPRESQTMQLTIEVSDGTAPPVQARLTLRYTH